MRRPTPTTPDGGWFWTDLRIYTPIRLIALVAILATVVVACGREAAISGALDEVFMGGAETQAPVEPTVGEKLDRDAEAIRAVIPADAPQKLAAEKRKEVTDFADRVSARASEIHGQLSANLTKLRGGKHDAAADRLAEVDQAVTAARGEFDRARARFAKRPTSKSAAQLRASLDKLAPPAEQQPLSTGMSFGATEPTRETPALNSSTTPAYAAPQSAASASTLSREPESTDLVQVPETTTTPELAELAESLEHDPVRIFNFVRSEIKFEPYYGIRKGAAGTLEQKAGSDADQSALLVALLRESDVPARFVRGTAEVTPAQLAAWLGLPEQADPTRLADILASGGIPTSRVTAGGEVSKIRFARTWVQAYVPEQAYRGVDEGLGESRWVPLDPAAKKLVAAPDELPESSATEAELEEVADALVGATTVVDGGHGATFDTAQVESLMGDLLAGSGTDVHTDIDSPLDVDGVRIDESELPVLPGSLPFRTLAVTAEERSLPTSLIARVAVAVTGSTPGGNAGVIRDDAGGVELTIPAMDLASKRFTIGYSPASSADSDLIDEYHGLFGAPAGSAMVVPVFRLGGEVVASGSDGVPFGFTQRFQLRYISPGFSPDVVENPLTAGGLTALSVDVGSKSVSGIRGRATSVDALADETTVENVLTDARFGEMLGIAGDMYFLRNDLFNTAAAAQTGVHAQRAVSGALAQMGLSTTTIGGFPVAVDASGVTMDVDQDVHAVVPLTAGGEVDDFLAPAASFASDSEAAGLEGAFATSGAVSTTRVLGQAAKEGIAIYSVTADNFNEVRPNLVVDSGTLRQITDAVQMGATVTLPQRTPTIDGWAGSAYIVEHEGSLAYRISGGMNGAAKKLGKVPGAGYAVYGVVQLLMVIFSGNYADLTRCWFAVAFRVSTYGMGLAMTSTAKAIVAEGIAASFAAGFPIFVLITLVLFFIALYFIQRAAQQQCVGEPTSP